MNTLQFKTTCLTFSLVFLTCIFCQRLYKTDYQQNNILNRESKDVSLQCLLDETEALLKKKTSDLQNCIDKMDAHNENPCYGNVKNIRFFPIFYFLFYKYYLPTFFFFIAIEKGVQHIIAAKY